MSLPVQVIIGHRSELRSKAQAVMNRLQTSQGIQIAHLYELTDGLVDTEVERLTRQRSGIISSAVGRSEGGYAQILLAANVQEIGDLSRILAKLPHPDVSLKHRFAVAIAEVKDAVPLMALHCQTVHIVPRLLGRGGELNQGNRIQVASNILGLLLDMARSDNAVDQFEQWTECHPDLQETLTQVARFSAPAVQHTLATRLAFEVTRNMLRMMDEEALPSDIRLTPFEPAELVEQVSHNSREIGKEIAGRVLSGDGHGPLPDDDTIHHRVHLETLFLSQRLQSLTEEHGHKAMQYTIDWVAGLRAEIDKQLELHEIPAIRPLKRALLKLQSRERSAAGVVKAGVSSLEDISFPSSAPVQEAYRQLTSVRDNESTGMLFGAWVMLVTVLTVVTLEPVVADLVTPLPASPTMLDQVLAEPNTFSVLFGLIFMLAAGLVGGLVASQRRRQRSERESDYQGKLEQYMEDWENSIVSVIEQVGAVLQQRMRRFALEGIQAELMRLETVEKTIDQLAVRYRAEREPPARGMGATFDSDVPLSPAFYNMAQGTVVPEQLLNRLSEDLRRPTWRHRMALMDPERVLEEGRTLFGRFAERIPFEDNMDLRENVREDTQRIIVEMERKLAGLMPYATQNVQRAIVLPGALETQVPEDLLTRSQMRSFSGASDVFVSVSRYHQEVP